MTNQMNLQGVDWSKIPAPLDDGAMAHLASKRLPAVALAATDGSLVTLSEIAGRVVVYGYPMTGQPGVALPDGWDQVPGARGCTPQSCAFRDHHAELIAAGTVATFGISTQDSASAGGGGAAAFAVSGVIGCGAGVCDGCRLADDGG